MSPFFPLRAALLSLVLDGDAAASASDPSQRVEQAAQLGNELPRVLGIVRHLSCTESARASSCEEGAASLRGTKARRPVAAAEEEGTAKVSLGCSTHCVSRLTPTGGEEKTKKGRAHTGGPLRLLAWRRRRAGTGARASKRRETDSLPPTVPGLAPHCCCPLVFPALRPRTTLYPHVRRTGGAQCCAAVGDVCAARAWAPRALRCGGALWRL